MLGSGLRLAGAASCLGCCISLGTSGGGSADHPAPFLGRGLGLGLLAGTSSISESRVLMATAAAGTAAWAGAAPAAAAVGPRIVLLAPGAPAGGAAAPIAVPGHECP